MAQTLNTDVETLSHRLTDGLQKTLEAAIKGNLMAQADVIVSGIAREMAQSLHGKVHVYRDHMEDRLQIVLVLDGVKELVPPRAP
jgi:hypothetical protein